jgi:hypothetical protein
MAAAATVVAVGGAATASAAPTNAAATAPSDGKKAEGNDATVAKVAASLHVSVKQLSGEKPKPGKDKPSGVPEQAVKLLAAELHISVDRARQVYRDLEKVKARGDDIVKDPAFVAIAKGLHITPQQLLATLRKVKQEIAGKPKDGAPTK